MNIVILNSRDQGGGAAEIARQVAGGYEAAGHRVHWLVGTRTRSDRAVTEVPLRGSTGWIARLGERLLGWDGPPHGRARLRWRRLLQAAHFRSARAQRRGWEDFELSGAAAAFHALPWRPDVLHLHNLHSFNHHTHFDLRLLPRLTRDVTTVLTLHDPWMLTGHCAHFFACERWRVGCGHCPALDAFPPLRRDATRRNWQVKADIYRASRFHAVGVSAWMAGLAARSMLAPGLASLRVIRNGIDAGTFRPAADRAAVRAALGISRDAKVIAFSSELGARNPFRDFPAMQATAAEAARRLAPQQVVSIELGAETTGHTRHGNHEVRSPGFVPRAEMIRWLQASDLLLHAAVADTLPTVIFEAMACGVPVVATAVCGIPEQIEHRRTGWLVPAGSTEEMIEAAHGLLRDGRLAAALGTAARGEVEKRFTVDQMVRQYVTLLDELAPP